MELRYTYFFQLTSMIEINSIKYVHLRNSTLLVVCNLISIVQIQDRKTIILKGVLV